MSSKIPFVRTEISWIAITIKLLFVGCLLLFFYMIDKKNFYIEATLIYLTLSYGLRILVPTDHRKGIALLKHEKFEEAAFYFQKSTDFFTKYAWVDKYRALTLFINSKRTFREISLCNTAYCLLQNKKVDEAKAIYEGVLNEYQGNIVARSALRTINSIEQKDSVNT